MGKEQIESAVQRYCVVTYYQPTDHETSTIVAATSPDEAMAMVERTGIDYTDAQVRLGNYSGEVLAEYGPDNT